MIPAIAYRVEAADGYRAYGQWDHTPTDPAFETGHTVHAPAAQLPRAAHLANPAPDGGGRCPDMLR